MHEVPTFNSMDTHDDVNIEIEVGHGSAYAGEVNTFNQVNPMAVQAHTVLPRAKGKEPFDPEVYGNLNLVGPDACKGFLKECVNCVWEPTSIVNKKAVGVWRNFAFNYRDNVWEEVSDEVFEVPLPNDKVQALEDRYLVKRNNENTGENEPYKSRYKFIHLCHHRGFTAVAPEAEKDVDESKPDGRNARFKPHIESLTIERRRLCDKVHLMSIFWLLFSLLIGTYACFEPIVSGYEGFAERYSNNDENKIATVANLRLAGTEKGQDYVAEQLGEKDSVTRWVFGLTFLSLVLLGFYQRLSFFAMVEQQHREIFWYSAFEHGLLMNFENEHDEPGKLFFNPASVVGNLLVLFTLISLWQTCDWTDFFWFSYLVIMSIRGLYAPMSACLSMEEGLVSISKFVEGDYQIACDLLNNSLPISEINVLNRLSDCYRWQKVMLCKWCETRSPPIQWNFVAHLPYITDPDILIECKKEQLRLAFNFEMLVMDYAVLPEAGAFNGQSVYGIELDKFQFALKMPRMYAEHMGPFSWFLKVWDKIRWVYFTTRSKSLFTRWTEAIAVVHFKDGEEEPIEIEPLFPMNSKIVNRLTDLLFRCFFVRCCFGRTWTVNDKPFTAGSKLKARSLHVTSYFVAYIIIILISSYTYLKVDNIDVDLNYGSTMCILGRTCDKTLCVDNKEVSEFILRDLDNGSGFNLDGTVVCNPWFSCSEMEYGHVEECKPTACKDCNGNDTVCDWIGDSVCDHWLNCVSTGFDGGDCR